MKGQRNARSVWCVSGRRWARGWLRALVVVSLFVLATSRARAVDDFQAPLPGFGGGCIGCHLTHEGGVGCPCATACLNAFGLAVQDIVETDGVCGLSSAERNAALAAGIWSPALAAIDHDGDGYSSGIELGESRDLRRRQLQRRRRLSSECEIESFFDCDNRETQSVWLSQTAKVSNQTEHSTPHV